MKLKTLCMAMLIAAGSIGVANATPNLIQNGDFSNTSGFTSLPGYTNQQVGFKGFTVNDWTGGGYTIWYPNANDAVNGCGYTIYHYPGSPDGACSTLNAVGSPVPGGSTFVALDGVSGSLQGNMKQQLMGLTKGDHYAVTFYWGTTQETQASDKVPSHQQYLQVSLGGQSKDTNMASTTWGDFNGWFKTTMNFTADSATPWLNFLSFGLPSDGPPMILLANVSVVNTVPEPPDLALFGGGLLGLGLLTVFARRRALRKQGGAGGLA